MFRAGGALVRARDHPWPRRAPSPDEDPEAPAHGDLGKHSVSSIFCRRGSFGTRWMDRVNKDIPREGDPPPFQKKKGSVANPYMQVKIIGCVGAPPYCSRSSSQANMAETNCFRQPRRWLNISRYVYVCDLAKRSPRTRCPGRWACTRIYLYEKKKEQRSTSLCFNAHLSPLRQLYEPQSRNLIITWSA